MKQEARQIVADFAGDNYLTDAGGMFLSFMIERAINAAIATERSRCAAYIRESCVHKIGRIYAADIAAAIAEGERRG